MGKPVVYKPPWSIKKNCGFRVLEMGEQRYASRPAVCESSSSGSDGKQGTAKRRALSNAGEALRSTPHLKPCLHVSKRHPTHTCTL